MTKFNRSSFMKQRHADAKVQREIYSNKFGNESKENYSSFLRKETPLGRQVVIYQVSYQVSYSGAVNTMNSNMTTFEVISFRGNEGEIQNRTMNMVLDSKGTNNDRHLNVGLMNALDNSTDVKILPRGLEETRRNLTSNELNQLKESQFIVNGLDSELKVKNKQNREGSLKLDVRHFY